MPRSADVQNLTELHNEVKLRTCLGAVVDWCAGAMSRRHSHIYFKRNIVLNATI